MGMAYEKPYNSLAHKNIYPNVGSQNGAFGDGIVYWESFNAICGIIKGIGQILCALVITSSIIVLYNLLVLVYKSKVLLLTFCNAVHAKVLKLIFCFFIIIFSALLPTRVY